MVAMSGSEANADSIHALGADEARDAVSDTVSVEHDSDLRSVVRSEASSEPADELGSPQAANTRGFSTPTPHITTLHHTPHTTHHTHTPKHHTHTPHTPHTPPHTPHTPHTTHIDTHAVHTPHKHSYNTLPHTFTAHSPNQHTPHTTLSQHTPNTHDTFTAHTTGHGAADPQSGWASKRLRLRQLGLGSAGPPDGSPREAQQGGKTRS